MNELAPLEWTMKNTTTYQEWLTLMAAEIVKMLFVKKVEGEQVGVTVRCGDGVELHGGLLYMGDIDPYVQVSVGSPGHWGFGLGIVRHSFVGNHTYDTIDTVKKIISDLANRVKEEVRADNERSVAMGHKQEV